MYTERTARNDVDTSRANRRTSGVVNSGKANIAMSLRLAVESDMAATVASLAQHK